MNNTALRRVLSIPRPLLYQQFCRTPVFRPFSSSSSIAADKPSDLAPEGTTAGNGGGQKPDSQQPLSGLGKLSNETKPLSTPTSEILDRMQNTVLQGYPETRSHHLHVYATKHNTHITLTRPNHDPMMVLTCGSIGLRKAKRHGYDAAYQLSVYAMMRIQERGFLLEVKALEVILRGFGPGRETFTKVLLGTQGQRVREKVVRVSDNTRIKFGGTKSHNVRRLG